MMLSQSPPLGRSRKRRRVQRRNDLDRRHPGKKNVKELRDILTLARLRLQLLGRV